MNSDRKWSELMEALLGHRVYPKQVATMEDLLNAPEDDGGCDAHAGNRELCDVVIFLSQRGEKVPERLTVGWLFSKVKWMRSVRAAERTGKPLSDEDALVAACKSAMLRAPDHHERFAILCDPRTEIQADTDTDLGQCKRLDEWAANRWPNWTDTVTAIREQMGRAIRGWMDTARGGVCRCDGQESDGTVNGARCPTCGGRVI